MSEMNICDACERHVYADEPACPFCGSTDPRRPIPRVRAGGRLSRAAVHAVGAAVLVGTAGCYQSHGQDGPRAAPDAHVTPVADASAPGDGGLPRDAAILPRDAGDGDDAGPRDAAVADASTPDAGDVDGGGGIPIYGGVFPDPRERAVV